MINKLIIFISFSFLIASIETSNLNVKGMMCGMSCADKIEKQINKIDGIKQFNLSYEKSLLIIDYDSSITTESQIINILNDNTTYAFTSKANNQSTYRWFLNIFGF